jgi:hypothetical protein
MADSTTFSLRHNANRAAEKVIAAGTAPSLDYGIKTRDDGRFEIVWKTQAATTEEVEAEIVTASAAAEERPEAAGNDPAAEADRAVATDRIAEIDQHPGRIVSGPALEERLAAMDEGKATAEPAADPWPRGARVQVRISKRRIRHGTIDYRVDANHWRVVIDGAPAGISLLYTGADLSASDAPPPRTRDQGRKEAAGCTGALRASDEVFRGRRAGRKGRYASEADRHLKGEPALSKAFRPA